MNKAKYNAALLNLSLERSSQDSLQRQLAQALRDMIHDQRLRTEDRLPSSRSLAKELSVSRVTVTAVYDQLIAEGYLEGRHRSGVYVTADLENLPTGRSNTSARPQTDDEFHLQKSLPCAPTTPDLREFPYREWARLLEKTWRAPSDALLARPNPAGWWPLRAAIARHLSDWRGLDCNPEQVIITSGITEGIELVARALFQPGDGVMIEDPGYHILRHAISTCGQRCIPVRVDAQGFDIAEAAKRNPDARAAVVTPSRQFPLGMVLPLARRLALLAWARETDSYIFEDDFDGEYRYRGHPLPALMSLDDENRVFYFGSFSKVMFPTLRLGYVVGPQQHVDGICRSLARSGPRASLVCQPALAEFIDAGDFATHIRRMRRLYASRQAALLAALSKYANGTLHAESEPAGMHLVALLGGKQRDKTTDIAVADAASAAGIPVQALSTYFAGPADLSGLVLGYAGFTEDEIDAATKVLCASIKHRS